MHPLTMAFLTLAVLLTTVVTAFSDHDDMDLQENEDGEDRSLFVYEPTKKEPMDGTNVTGLVVCLVIGGLLAVCCLWLRHRQPADSGHLCKDSNNPFHSV